MRGAAMKGGENTVAAKSVERRLAALDAMDLTQLRGEWRRVIKTEPSVRLSTDLLRRGVAYRLQEAAFGGLRADVGRTLAAGSSSNRPSTTSTIKAGTTFIREWHGRIHTVQALEEGFEFDGRRYASLTKIAHEITGAAWSGPRFFGLVNARAARPKGVRPPHA